MSESVPCKQPCNCIQFPDFVPSSPTDRLYVNTAQSPTVTCPAGNQVTVPIPAGVVGYVLKFQIGEPPYPNLTLNCTGGNISIPVASSTTQSQLDALILGMLNSCVAQIAVSLGCSSGSFFNTEQQVPCANGHSVSVIAVPAGVFVLGSGEGNFLAIAAGTIFSDISVGDANGKAIQLLNELFETGNAVCSPT